MQRCAIAAMLHKKLCDYKGVRAFLSAFSWLVVKLAHIHELEWAEQDSMQFDCSVCRSYVLRPLNHLSYKNGQSCSPLTARAQLAGHD